MSKVSNALPLTIPLDIPAYWTPEQAFAVVELLMTCAIESGRTRACSCSTNTASNTAKPTLITPKMQLTIRRSE
jgi:hypothetical protein